MEQVAEQFNAFFGDLPLVTLSDMQVLVPPEKTVAGFLEFTDSFVVTRDLPFMDPRYPLVFSCGYLIAVYFFWKLMSFFKAPFPLARLMAIFNNFFMSLLSLVMLVGMLVGLYQLGSLHQWNPHILFCDTQQVFTNKGMLHYFLYVFYVSKLYELIDTIILCLKKSTLSFLHIFHHAYTMWMVWGGLYYLNPLQWTEFLNAFVHVPMYYYFGMLDLTGKRASWKKLITVIQLVQFTLIISAMGMGYLYHYQWNMNCSSFGDSWNNEWSLAGLVFYLYLFGSLYMTRYTPKKEGETKDDGKKDNKKDNKKKGGKTVIKKKNKKETEDKKTK